MRFCPPNQSIDLKITIEKFQICILSNKILCSNANRLLCFSACTTNRSNLIFFNLYSIYSQKQQTNMLGAKKKCKTMSNFHSLDTLETFVVKSNHVCCSLESRWVSLLFSLWMDLKVPCSYREERWKSRSCLCVFLFNFIECYASIFCKEKMCLK